MNVNLFEGIKVDYNESSGSFKSNRDLDKIQTWLVDRMKI